MSVEEADKTADDSVQIIEEEKSEKTDSDKPEKESNKPEKESNKGVKEASTFIASAAAASDVKAGTPILSRRVVKTSTTEKNAETVKTSTAENADTEKETEKEVEDAGAEKSTKKEIRRNSKGFERFEDYFSDSADEGDNSTADKSTKSPAKESDKNVDKESNGDAVKSSDASAKAMTDKDVDKKSTEAKKKPEPKEVRLRYVFLALSRKEHMFKNKLQILSCMFPTFLIDC